jgi:hypothetical protein
LKAEWVVFSALAAVGASRCSPSHRQPQPAGLRGQDALQLGQAGDVVRDPPLQQDRAGGVDQAELVERSCPVQAGNHLICWPKVVVA